MFFRIYIRFDALDYPKRYFLGCFGFFCPIVLVLPHVDTQPVPVNAVVAGAVASVVVKTLKPCGKPNTKCSG